MKSGIMCCLAAVSLVLAACGRSAAPLPQPNDVQTPQPSAPTALQEREPATPEPSSPISPPPTPTPSPEAVISPVDPPTPTPTGMESQSGADPADAAIVYRRSGGLAGITEEWIVYPDGRVTGPEGPQWQLGAQRLEQILADAEALGFFDMESRYVPDNVCCDRFTYELIIRQGDQVNRVTTVDAAPDAPPELWRIMEEFNRQVISQAPAAVHS